MPRKVKVKAATVVRREAAAEDQSHPNTPQDANEVFRQYFEQRYAPLEPQSIPVPEQLDLSEACSSDGTGDSESWSGFSEVEDNGPVQVVDYTQSSQGDELALDKSYKSYMSSKPPKTGAEHSSSKTAQKQPQTSQQDTDDTANLKNDLALQRLLKESHLLESNQETTPVGSQRHKALDLRLQALGSKDSILAQTKMPLSHRKGMKAKASAIETRRRIEAKENGIILERPMQASRIKAVRCERAVGGPGIGKFRGGTLSLSRKDLQSIQGSGSKGRRTKKR